MDKADTLNISEVTSENFDAFINLIAKLAEYESLPPPDTEAKKRLHKDYFEKQRYNACIAKLGDKYVGYIIYFYTYSSFLALPTLFLEDIFVLNEYRRQGVGEQMFKLIKQIAKRENCGRIEFAVLKWNRNAQEFYKKNGAKQLEWDIYRILKDDF